MTYKQMKSETKIYFASLGCDKNLVDSEHMLGILKNSGFSVTDECENADVIIVNTCCFIGDAMEESINTLLELAAYKEPGVGRAKGLIACGCLAQRHAEDIRREIPEVDVIVGTNSWEHISEAVYDVLDNSRTEHIDSLEGITPSNSRVSTGSVYYSYLKIAEGCNKRCTYCVIPYIRGNYRSVPMDELVKEAEELASQGISELILVAQELCEYGIDLYGKKSLPTLLNRLSGIHGIRWIRLLYCYPEEIDDELIREIRDNRKIVHYIDMPIQHFDDDILRKMGRKTTGSDISSIISKLRREIPDIAIRTTLITGFPGESIKAHQKLLSSLRELRFDRLGAFCYSREEGTPAFNFDDQIPDETKQERYSEIMTLQQSVSSEINQTMVGNVLLCVVEGRVTDASEGVSNVYAARSYRDAPDVDGFVFIETTEELMSGSYVYVKITSSNEYDLTGELTDNR